MKQIDWQKLRQKWFRRDNLIIMVLAGILLFVIALPTKTTGGQLTKGLGGTGQQKEREEASGKEADQANGEKTSIQNGGEMDYETLQEEKLTKLLSSMAGVGEVEVMLTFVSSEEQVVEKEEPVSRSGTVEQDSAGGTRSVTQYEKGDTAVYRNKEGEPFVTKVLYPRVDGVLVIAEGAGDGSVNRSITEAVQALFGVEAHRVKVLPMRNKHISQTGLIQ
ncbi:MAG: stage III sporulation protein AG [Lachnospiraceae bacterium]|nr:stage III sporulation protein AG [Lachnospiraceae bacterium]